MTPPRQSRAMEYDVTEPFGYTSTRADGSGVEIQLHWNPGKHSPKNEEEEAGLELGVERGYAKHLKKPKAED